MHDFLGSGWAFPPRVDARGRIALARQEQDVEEAIRMILLTPKGQRVMRPEFGCRIHDLAFAPNNSTLLGLASFYIEEALRMWEPRIHVEEVRARIDAESPERVLVDIQYRIKSSHDRRSLVFPFYRIPGEAAPETATGVAS
jgi:phage baseplate assembly protein W